MDFPGITQYGVNGVIYVTDPFQSTVGYVILNADPRFTMFHVFESLRSTRRNASRPANGVEVLAVNFLSASPTEVARSVRI